MAKGVTNSFLSSTKSPTHFPDKEMKSQADYAIEGLKLFRKNQDSRNTFALSLGVNVVEECLKIVIEKELGYIPEKCNRHSLYEICVAINELGIPDFNIDQQYIRDCYLAQTHYIGGRYFDYNDQNKNKHIELDFQEIGDLVDKTEELVCRYEVSRINRLSKDAAQMGDFFEPNKEPCISKTIKSIKRSTKAPQAFDGKEMKNQSDYALEGLEFYKKNKSSKNTFVLSLGVNIVEEYLKVILEREFGCVPKDYNTHSLSVLCNAINNSHIPGFQIDHNFIKECYSIQNFYTGGRYFHRNNRRNNIHSEFDFQKVQAMVTAVQELVNKHAIAYEKNLSDINRELSFYA